MKSRHLSILGDHSAEESIPPAKTAPAEERANYRARYQAFLNQQSQRGQRRAKPNAVVGVVQGVLNFAIFVVLFLAILTLFGFGLSRLNSTAQTASDLQASGRQGAATVVESSPSPIVHRKGRHK